MVHKKSEYTLQFHLVPQNLRKQLWQDNIKFRESRRVLNQAHHYWDYQIIDEPCECDYKLEDDLAALPPHRLKHKLLTAQYFSRLPDRQVQFGREAAVQTPDWEQRNRHEESMGQEIDNIIKKVKKTVISDVPQISKESKSRQTKVSSIKQASPETVSGEQLLEATEPQAQPESRRVRPCTAKRVDSTKSLAKDKLSDVQKHVEADFTKVGAEELARPSSAADSQHSQQSDSQHSRRSDSQRSRRSGLTRTTKRSYFEKKIPPFEAFGWNDSQKDVGGKKTYNVIPPETEVYESALRMLKRRREEIEQALREEVEKRKKKTSEADKVPVNLSSIWMTEYQRQFSQQKKPQLTSARPSTAPPTIKRWPSWW